MSVAERVDAKRRDTMHGLARFSDASALSPKFGTRLWRPSYEGEAGPWLGLESPGHCTSRGAAILVCGCGESLNTLGDASRTVTIGVNDVGRLFDPTYLLVV